MSEQRCPECGRVMGVMANGTYLCWEADTEHVLNQGKLYRQHPRYGHRYWTRAELDERQEVTE